MSHGVFCSTMDPCKTIARLQVGVIKPAKDSEIALELSYSEVLNYILYIFFFFI